MNEVCPGWTDEMPMSHSGELAASTSVDVTWAKSGRESERSHCTWKASSVPLNSAETTLAYSEKGRWCVGNALAYARYPRYPPKTRAPTTAATTRPLTRLSPRLLRGPLLLSEVVKTGGRPHQGEHPLEVLRQLLPELLLVPVRFRSLEESLDPIELLLGLLAQSDHEPLVLEEHLPALLEQAPTLQR